MFLMALTALTCGPHFRTGDIFVTVRANELEKNGEREHFPEGQANQVRG